MNLNERVAIDTALTRLTKAGYKKLGSGLFGEVYARPGEDFVLKLFNVTDHAYIIFLNFCLKNIGNSNLPKFNGKMVRVTEETYAVRMERLVKSPKSDSSILELIRDAFYDYLWADEEHNDADKLEQIDPNLADTLSALADYCVGKSIRNDLHPANIMKRGTTFVITDPIAVQI
jgi:hypothetical protein